MPAQEECEQNTSKSHCDINYWTLLTFYSCQAFFFFVNLYLYCGVSEDSVTDTALPLFPHGPFNIRKLKSHLC